MANIVTFTPEHSSHIERLSYNPDTERLQVRFANKSTYTFADVPPDVFAKMTQAQSQGEYFHKVIERFYPMVSKKTKGATIPDAATDDDTKQEQA